MTSHLAVAASLLAGAQVWAGQLTPFSALFRTADTVFVGEVESGRQIPTSDARAGMAAVDPVQYAPVYPCELTVRVRAVIKAQQPLIKAGSAVSVMWYLPSPVCIATYGGDGQQLTRPALWLARTENGTLRTLADNNVTVLPIKSFSTEIEERLTEWKDPGLAVTYLILKPGAIISENGYVSSRLPSDVVGITGFADFLKVYRVVYLESDARMRGLISLEVAGYGHCLEPARRAAEAERRRGEPVPNEAFLDREVERRTEEQDLAEENSWTTREQLLKVFGSAAEAVNGLTMRACMSDLRVKARARELLSQYFEVDPSRLPCIPCE